MPWPIAPDDEPISVAAYRNFALADRAHRLAKSMGVGESTRDFPAVADAADRILEDPQAHIDALVEAKVLRKIVPQPTGFRLSALYEVVKSAAPHAHDWMVDGWQQRNDVVRLVCRTDPSHVYTAVNRLPIQVPE